MGQMKISHLPPKIRLLSLEKILKNQYLLVLQKLLLYPLKLPTMQPHVFVVMPFGIKEAAPATPANGETPAKEALEVNFDQIYELLIAPALTNANCFPFRADQEKGASNIHTDMFFELVTADVVVADISILNPNVFYELGVRHAVRPRGVLMIHGGWSRRPFDIAPDRSFNYDGKLFEIPEAQRDVSWNDKIQKEVENLSKTFKGALEVDEQRIGSPVFNQLTGLKPADWSNISTARAKYFEQLFSNLKAKVEVAQANFWPADILTLAEDAPTRFYQIKLLWEAARSLVSMHHFEAAYSILKDLLALEPNHIGALTQLGLVLGRLQKIQEAKIHMANVRDKFKGDPEAQGILGRVYKDLWRAEWNRPESNLEERQQEAIINSAYAADAIRSYNIAQRQHLDSYYNGINVVSLLKLLEHLKAVTGDEPVDAGIVDLEELLVVVRMAAKAALNRAQEAGKHEDVIWAAATLGELELVAGDPVKAKKYYQQAANTPGISYFQIDSMLTQVELFECLAFNLDAVAAVISVLKQRQGRLKKPQKLFERTVLCSGHLIDAPDRKTPRFPPEKEDVVRDCIARELGKWNIGPGDLAICGGARGADILFAELCADRGADVWLFLALEEGEFLKESVRLPDGGWEDRFYNLRRRSKVKSFFQKERLDNPPKGKSPFARTNIWMINTALVEAKSPVNLYAILVWDELPTGDGPGGTSHFATQVERLGGHLSIINPTKLNLQ